MLVSLVLKLSQRLTYLSLQQLHQERKINCKEIPYPVLSIDSTVIAYLDALASETRSHQIKSMTNMLMSVIVGRACVLRRCSCGPRVFWVRHLVATLLFFSKVFVVHYYRVGCPYYWRSGSSWNLPSSRTKRKPAHNGSSTDFQTRN